MGTLTPGATYIYERVGDQIYAREVGSTVRTHVGGPATTWGHMESERWRKIVTAAETNTELREALERVILIYEMGFKEDGQAIDTERNEDV